MAISQLPIQHFLCVCSSCTVEFDDQSKQTKGIALVVALCTASLVFCWFCKAPQVATDIKWPQAGPFQMQTKMAINWSGSPHNGWSCIPETPGSYSVNLSFTFWIMFHISQHWTCRLHVEQLPHWLVSVFVFRRDGFVLCAATFCWSHWILAGNEITHHTSAIFVWRGRWCVFQGYFPKYSQISNKLNMDIPGIFNTLLLGSLLLLLVSY